MMLMTKRAGTNAPSFLLGWVAGILAVEVIVFLIPIDQSEKGETSAVAGYIRIGLGVLLLAVAARQWLGRPGPDEEVEGPRFLAGLDSFTEVKSSGNRLRACCAQYQKPALVRRRRRRGDRSCDAKSRRAIGRLYRLHDHCLSDRKGEGTGVVRHLEDLAHSKQPGRRCRHSVACRRAAFVSEVRIHHDGARVGQTRMLQSESDREARKEFRIYLTEIKAQWVKNISD